VRVNARSDDAIFDQWMGEISHNPDAPPDDPGVISAGWQRWLRRVFETQGPVAKDVVTRAAMEHQLALANDAVTTVLADLHRTTDARPVVEVDSWMDSSIRISIDGGSTAPSMWEIEQPEALAEVADYFQEQLDQDPIIGSIWPVCAEHDVGLRAEVRQRQAVWWCRLGDHVVATIGQLGAAT
jgi:hypothetical protein